MIDPDVYPSAMSPEHLITGRIARQERMIVEEGLAQYEPRAARIAWFETLRAIEECINLVHVNWNDEAFKAKLFSLPLAWVNEAHPIYRDVCRRLLSKFNPDFVARFEQLVMQVGPCARDFARLGGDRVAIELQNFGSMIGYFQSRRRHFIAMLHMIPVACRGRQVVTAVDSLAVFLPMVEISGIQINSLQGMLNAKLSREKLGMPARASVDFEMLDPLFLELDRAPMTTMPISRDAEDRWEDREELRSDRLFSAAELRNDILASEITYEEFDLKETDFFPAAELVRRLSREFVEEDFWVVVSSNAMVGLLDDCDAPPALRAALVNAGSSYMDCLSTYAPFILVDGVYRSSVTLLSRFIYYWRSRTLDRRKRFQIRAGFIFEKAVAREVARQGFVWQEDIKRIDRQEFDVVTVRDGIIWNIQCKNNLVDINQLERQPRRYASYNYRLVRAYEAALAKEKAREHLLKERLSLSEVQHMIVSRFPVISDNQRFVPYSRIGEFAERADAVLAFSAGV